MSFLFCFNAQMCPQPVLQGSFDCNFRILSKQKSLQKPQQALGQSVLVRRAGVFCVPRRAVCAVGARPSSSRIFAVLSLISVSYSPFAVFVFGAVVALHVAAAMLYQQLYSRIEEYGGGKRADNAPKHHIVFCVKYARLIYDKRHDVGKANLKSDCKPTRFRAVQFSERSGDCRNAWGRKQIEGHEGISGQRSEHCSVHA